MNLTIHANASGNVDNGTIFSSNSGEVQKNRKTFFAGDTNLANDPVAQKRKEAQEKAWKVVKNAWDNDDSVDKSIQSRKDHYSEMEQKKIAAEKELTVIGKEEASLKEDYGVSDDSPEQKDLELLKKRQDIENGVLHESLTQEEAERIAEIEENGLTEYQKRALEWNDRAGKFRKEVSDCERQMKDAVSDIKSIEQERLKSNPMLDAKKAADAIIDAANQEIIGMLVEEAKEHIDEKIEEAEEKAKEKAEEKEEKEEQLEEIQEMRALQQAVIEGTKEAVEEAEAKRRENDAPDIELTDIMELAKPTGQTEDVQKSLTDIKNSMNLLEADLKGIKVDEEV